MSPSTRVRSTAWACRALAFATIALSAQSSIGETLLYPFGNPLRAPRGPLGVVGTGVYGMALAGGHFGGGGIYKFDRAAGPFFQSMIEYGGVLLPPQGGVLAANGTIYWATNSGGANGSGEISKRDVQSQFSSVLRVASFPASGATLDPAPLATDGTFLYGVTTSGGAFGLGYAYKVDLSSGTFTTLGSFDGANGASSKSSLIASGNFLYGTASGGGSGSVGTVFKIDKTSGAISTLVAFTGPNGSIPRAELLPSGSFFYGTTYSGGASNNGTIFKIDANGNLTTVFSFTGGIDGRNPEGGLTLYGGSIYGTTRSASTNNRGTVFELNPVNDTIVRHVPVSPFSIATLDSTLSSAGGFLYGTTSTGIFGGSGQMLQFDPAGVSAPPFLIFSPSEALNPVGAVVINGSFAYGASQNGSSGELGTVWRINLRSPFQRGGPTGTLFQATGSGGIYPTGGLVLSNNSLWGTAQQGGTTGCGTLFKVDPNTMAVTRVASLSTAATGCTPVGGLLDSGGFLYGVTQSGGSNGRGTVFRADPASGAVTIFGSLDTSSSFGFDDHAAMTAAGGFLYGTTQFGASGEGNIFKVDSSGVTTTLALFNSSITGSHPNGVIASGNFLYGTCAYGGPNGAGTVFKVDRTTGQITVLVSFGGSVSNGLYPRAGLALQGTDLVGTTNQGGADGFGTLFKVDTNGGGFTTLLSFADTAGYPQETGVYPAAPVTVAGRYIYAMSSLGGRGGGGVLFSTNTPPVFTVAAPINRTIGTPASAAAVGTVSDVEDPASSITVTHTGTTMNVSSIAVDGAGSVTASIGAPCTAPAGTLYVPFSAQDAGYGTTSNFLQVDVTANPAPTLGTYSSAPINAGQSATIRPSASPSDNGTYTLAATPSAGFTGTLSICQSSGTGCSSGGVAGDLVITNPNAGSHTITITATDNCGVVSSPASFGLTVNATFGPPQNFAATAVSAQQVTLSWLPVSGDNPRYDIYRRTHVTDGWGMPIASVTMPGFNDVNVAAGVTYLYKVAATIVRASDGATFGPADSVVDAATTIIPADDPLPVSATVKAAHLQDVRTLINSMRAAANLSPATFADNPAAGSPVKAIHLTQLRSAVDEIRQALGELPVTWVDPTITPGVTTVRAVHLLQLRSAVQ